MGRVVKFYKFSLQQYHLRTPMIYHSLNTLPISYFSRYLLKKHKMFHQNTLVDWKKTSADYQPVIVLPVVLYFSGHLPRHGKTIMPFWQLDITTPTKHNTSNCLSRFTHVGISNFYCPKYFASYMSLRTFEHLFAISFCRFWQCISDFINVCHSCDIEADFIV